MPEPSIIYKDQDIVIIDKPSGLITHPVHSDDQGLSVASWLLRTFPQVEGVGEEEGRWGIVHRLDRGTSGVMMAALTETAYVRLKKQFTRREVQKTYRAFVYGAIKEERGVIEKEIGRSSSGNRTARLPATPEAGLPFTREAATTFRTLERSTLASYLELYPQTGRTHQLRVHLSALQHPIVCDERYAPGRVALLGFHRLALHAYKLSFVHPITGKEVSFEAPLPEDFQEGERELKVMIDA